MGTACSVNSVQIGPLPTKATVVYGWPLTEHLTRTNRNIALPVELCIATLTKFGLDQEGLFRRSGVLSRINALKAAFDSGHVNTNVLDEYETDIHCVAGVLKQYLRELPEPLMTFTLYGDFIEAGKAAQNQRKQAVKDVVNKLPDANRNNLSYLMKFLAKVAEHENTNKMTAGNLAVVFGPNLLWSRSYDQLDMHTAIQNAVTEMLICDVELFFPEAPPPPVREENQLRIMIIGRAGVGKSSTANTILGEQRFSTGTNPSLVTVSCQMEHTTRLGQNLLVMDTPGLFDTTTDTDNVTEQLKNGLSLLKPGPRAILFVTNLGRFTQEDARTIEVLEQLLGPEMYRFTIVVFTRLDDLDRGETLESYIQQAPEHLRQLLGNCDNRHIGINNKVKPDNSGNKLRELLGIISTISQDDQNYYVSNLCEMDKPRQKQTKNGPQDALQAELRKKMSERHEPEE